MIKLSIIVVAYNMSREIPRALQSLGPGYQQGVDGGDYEVLVIENGSSRPLDAAAVASFGPQFHYHYLDNAPSSPAYALNYGAGVARGEILCFMIDGAHLLTPGVLRFALAAFQAFAEPVVLTRYFYLGPGQQNETILQGYDQQVEDDLLRQIAWPGDGYRLFEIGVPFMSEVPKMTWFNKMIESNCLFMRKEIFAAIGGANEQFDFPGGGFLNMDICREATGLAATQAVLLVGEGSFHQVHGGTTTNVAPGEREEKVADYQRQYQAIRGREFGLADTEIFYLGHMPTEHSKIHRRHRPPGPLAGEN